MAKPSIDLSGVDLRIVDLDKYDFEGLRTDVSNILNVPQAAISVAKWAVLIPVVGSVITWLIFTSRMSGAAFTLFMMTVVLALVLLAVNVGIFMVLRSRLAETNTAAERVIEMTSELHGDYLKIRTGQTDLPMGALAAALTEQLVFPALSGGLDSASAMAGPMGFALRPLLKRPMAAVEQRVLKALNETPMPALGSGKAARRSETSDDSTEVLTGELMPDLPTDVGDWYHSVHSGLRRVVSGVSVVATGSMGVMVLLSTVPIITLVILGWLLT